MFGEHLLQDESVGHAIEANVVERGARAKNFAEHEMTRAIKRAAACAVGRDECAVDVEENEAKVIGHVRCSVLAFATGAR